MSRKKAIFDASTLILLAKTTLLRSFTTSYEIIITPMVKKEALAKKEQEDTHIIHQLIEQKIITIAEPVNTETLTHDFLIGAGEAEALQLALKEKTLLCTDDWRAIKACKILDIPFNTAIHCLLHIFQKGTIDKTLALEKLKNLETYGRYNTFIINHAKTRITGGT